MAPLVSVLVPVYNSINFVDDCINSILAQTYVNIEILIADDFSTDGSREAIRKYTRDTRVKLILNERNIGITNNCNQLLFMSSGKYISLFAGDDIMLPNKLDFQVKLMERMPNYSFCYHDVDVFQSETGNTLYSTRRIYGSPILTVHDVIRRMGIPGGMSVMFKRDNTPSAGFDTRLSYASDWLFQIDLAMSGDIGYINTILARYRKHGTNNGKDLASYEAEFPKVLSFAEIRYPKLARTCAQGHARYCAGLAFRQDSILNFRVYMKKALKSDSSLTYYLALFLSYIPFFFKFKSLIVSLSKICC